MPLAHATLRVHVTPSSSAEAPTRPPMRAVTRPGEASPASAESEPSKTHQSCSPLNHPSSPPLSKWPPSPATLSAAVTPPLRRLRCVSTCHPRAISRAPVSPICPTVLEPGRKLQSDLGSAVGNRKCMHGEATDVYDQARRGVRLCAALRGSRRNGKNNDTG